MPNQEGSSVRYEPDGPKESVSTLGWIVRAIIVVAVIGLIMFVAISSRK